MPADKVGVPPVDLDKLSLGSAGNIAPISGAAGGLAPSGSDFLPGERITTPGAPLVDLDRVPLEHVPSTTPGAKPIAARRVAEAAGHAVPKTPAELASEADYLDEEELTGAEIALLRRFLRDGFPGERIVTPAQAREIRGHLGGQSIY